MPGRTGSGGRRTRKPERQLADSLGVSRVTVQRAYAELSDNEFLVPRGRSGFLVRRRGQAEDRRDRAVLGDRPIEDARGRDLPQFPHLLRACA
jgi:DNA-binding transcriptional regulator YhcF (GntR family)